MADHVRTGCTAHSTHGQVPPVLGSHLLHPTDNAGSGVGLPWQALQQHLLVEPQELHVGLLLRLQQEQGLPAVAHASGPAAAVDKGTAACSSHSLSTTTRQVTRLSHDPPCSGRRIILDYPVHRREVHTSCHHICAQQRPPVVVCMHGGEVLRLCMWGGGGWGMQGPPLELHKLCKDRLSLGLHLAVQSHKHSTSYKSRGEGRANQYGQANFGRRACSLDTLTQPTQSTCSPQRHTLQRTPSLCAPAWKEGGGVRGLQGGWVRWIPCALAGSPQGRLASPLPAPPSIRGGVRAGQQDHIHFRDNLAHCVEVL